MTERHGRVHGAHPGRADHARRKPAPILNVRMVGIVGMVAGRLFQNWKSKTTKTGGEGEGRKVAPTMRTMPTMRKRSSGAACRCAWLRHPPCRPCALSLPRPA